MTELVLASGSRTRREMLTAAGVTCRIVPADVDEGAIRDQMVAANTAVDPRDVAGVLARAKAEAVSRQHPAALVIGADQILALEARMFAKPVDISEARSNLLDLRGHTHQLHSVVALARGGTTEWTHGETAHLTIRQFSHRFLDDYIASAGAKVCESVGAYQLESLGINLFERIDGDYFTILGMPLLPLLAELRARGVLAS